MIDAKILDVDYLKTLFATMSLRKGGKKYDFRKSEDVAELHGLIDSKGWKDKTTTWFVDSLKQTGRLPNVILDTTGKSKVEANAAKFKELGYKVSVVWVLTNRQWAMFRNLIRDRVVPQDIFHEIHDDVKKNMKNVLQTGARDIDEFWLIWSGEKGDVVFSELPKSARGLKGTTMKLVKKGNSFVLSDRDKELIGDLMTAVDDFLGPDAETEGKGNYKSFDDFSKDMSKSVELVQKDQTEEEKKKNLTSWRPNFKDKNFKISGYATESVDTTEDTVDESNIMGDPVVPGEGDPKPSYNERYDGNDFLDYLIEDFVKFSERFTYREEAFDKIENFIQEFYRGNNEEIFRSRVRANRKHIVEAVSEEIVTISLEKINKLSFFR